MPRVDTSVLDALLETARAASVSELYVCETRPTDRTGAIANALHTGAVTRDQQGAISGAAGLGQDGGDRRYTDGPYANITLDNITATQTPTYVALCNATTLLLVADTTGASAVPNNTVIDLSAWQHIVNAPTV